MEILMQRGCINDWLGIDDIREVDMTDEQRKIYFDKIVQNLPKIDPGFFNSFLQWVCEEYGFYDVSETTCPICGDYTEIYKLEIDENA